MSILCLSGKSPFGYADDGHYQDEGCDQTVPNMSSPSRGSPNSQSGVERIERYSRKVFVGGLPPDIDEGKPQSSQVHLKGLVCSAGRGRALLLQSCGP